MAQLSIRSGAHNFSADFETFRNFWQQFREIAALSSDECENYVVLLKEESPVKKTLQTESKSGNKRQRNACSNYEPLERTVSK